MCGLKPGIAESGWMPVCSAGAVVVCHGGQLTGAAAAAHLLMHMVIYMYILYVC